VQQKFGRLRCVVLKRQRGWCFWLAEASGKAKSPASDVSGSTCMGFSSAVKGKMHEAPGRPQLSQLASVPRATDVQGIAHWRVPYRISEDILFIGISEEVGRSKAMKRRCT